MRLNSTDRTIRILEKKSAGFAWVMIFSVQAGASEGPLVEGLGSFGLDLATVDFRTLSLERWPRHAIKVRFSIVRKFALEVRNFVIADEQH